MSGPSAVASRSMSLNYGFVDASSKVASRVDTSCVAFVATFTVPASGEAAA